ncbi:ABC-three component system protein [Paenarthrobacter nitroguajacolicus]|uniref:ABC-three component system protein n=1 Tax=Paenarthrobacter nitroguajacolicus TaxID=211146 RepID=UPI002864596C|nr:ABC-three component system protein [Paenarthrobacter nitroguajacolicus]MDR6637424.1 hypothetical protein [Paenarthrobacter nitroguajacolicus]
MPSDFEIAFFHSVFSIRCIRAVGNAWEEFVGEGMSAKYGADFLQVDASGRGDKGCDGYVNGLMLACYGATSPSESYVAQKITGDYAKAALHWGTEMETWAFVHNNANGLPTLAARKMMEMRRASLPHVIEHWPPQVLWDNVFAELERAKLVRILGIPPSDRPAEMSYIAQCVKALSRTRMIEDLDDVQPVPVGKLEYNNFEPSTVDLITEAKNHTHHVRYYFRQATPGEQFQVSENLRMRYDGLTARLESADEVFHHLCDDLIAEADFEESMVDQEQQRSAAILVVTHFFESCLLFEMPEEGDHATAV